MPRLRKTQLNLLRCLLFLVLSCGSQYGCAPLLTGTSDPAKIQSIMDSTHARGCIYARASAKPWASATVVLVGTFGDPPPTLSECWKQMPPELP